MSRKEYIKVRVKKYKNLIQNHGVGGVARSLGEFIDRRIIKRKNFESHIKFSAKDVLIVSGAPGAPKRYRADFQAEQLENKGYFVDVIHSSDFKEECIEYYDIFIFHRVQFDPIYPEVISRITAQNKLAIYDIDDLSFELDHLKNREELRKMDKYERSKFIEGVEKYKTMIKLFDYAIVTTEALGDEICKYVKNVVINRNFPGKVLRNLHENVKRLQKDNIVLGYFSGSYTHNDDFALISDVIFKILKEYNDVELLVSGDIDLPKSIPDSVRSRIIRKPFLNWNEFPDLFGEIDINLVPLVKTRFNECKSEIKYIESSFSQVPTVASNLESYRYAIKDGVDGYLASTEEDWYTSITALILNQRKREEMGKLAYKNILDKYRVYYEGDNISQFIEKYKKKKITYLFHSTDISGGYYVGLEHMNRLQKRGFNVSCITSDNKSGITWFPDQKVPVIPINIIDPLKYNTDIAVATFWETTKVLHKINANTKYYLVQSKESLFYNPNNDSYSHAYKTYMSNEYKYLTVSKWCQNWLKEEFGHDSIYIPNGVRREIFNSKNRTFPINRKPRVLIEGDSDSYFRNIDEAFEIVKDMDVEVWYVSYGGKPKISYKFNKFFGKVPYFKMPDIYRKCDILLKTSKLDSFSYPPIEMMASGGWCVIALNEGNREYIKNDYNALTYEVGDIDEARKQLNRIINNESVRNKLVKNSIITVKDRDWEKSINILSDMWS